MFYFVHPNKRNDKPTAERLLRAFSNLTLTIIEVRGQRFGYVPPLNPLQQEIISLLGISPDIYSNFVDNSSSVKFYYANGEIQFWNFRFSIGFLHSLPFH